MHLPEVSVVAPALRKHCWQQLCTKDALCVRLQLLYVPQPSGKDLDWSSYVWRRGTVPIWWGVEIKSGGVGEATIVVSNDKPYRGTRR